MSGHTYQWQNDYSDQVGIDRDDEMPEDEDPEDDELHWTDLAYCAACGSQPPAEHDETCPYHPVYGAK